METADFLQCPGDGVLKFSMIRGETAAISSRALYPLKFIVPALSTRSACRVEDENEKDCTWVYVIGHGGGLVSGDRCRIRCHVDEGCTAVLTTQASTKLYHHVAGNFSSQILDADIGKDGLLVLLVDPIVPYASSRYVQTQTFRLAGDASSARGSLAAVDWFTCGRGGMGEVWALDHLESTTEVRVGGRRVLRDAVCLSALDGSSLSVRERMDPYRCMATVFLVGPRVSAVAAQVCIVLCTAAAAAVRLNVSIKLSMRMIGDAANKYGVEGVI
jgi:urease accessory protein